MKTGRALTVVAIALTGLATVLPNASAEEEFFGTGFREVTVVLERLILSDCGDDKDETSIVLQTRTGTVTYTGFLVGTGQVLTKTLVDTCLDPKNAHVTFRVLDTFESLTVRLTIADPTLVDKTGGAVVEQVGRAHAVEPGVFINESRNRILCGTGELKAVHGEGTVTASTGFPIAYQFWIHFGHTHDVGFDFLCGNLR